MQAGDTHVCLITGAHLCRNPRVVKEAEALSDAGYSVSVVGPVFTEELAALDTQVAQGNGWQHHVAVDLRSSGPQRLADRLARRIAAEAVARTGWQLPHALGYGLNRTLRLARHLDADLYIGHQELGLWVTDRLAREGWTVGVDLEDWYSEDLLPEARAQRPVRLLQRLERDALRRGGHVTTTSHALAGTLADTYGAAVPSVVYNAFPWTDRERMDGQALDRPDLGRPSLHWVSQTIGSGRGLEPLIDALARVHIPVDVHLRGQCSAGEEIRLRSLLPAHGEHRLLIHALVPPDELLSRIAEHDIGLALESSDPPSRDLTVTNKVLHFLLGGLAVVATDTAGQKEVAGAAPEAVRLCRADDPVSLAAAINGLVASPAALARAKEAALDAARTRFCWEHQVPVLLESVRESLAKRHANI